MAGVPVPVIAALHGHALGGGLQIALGADIRIATRHAAVGARGPLGPRAGHDGTLFLSRLVRPDVAKELTFTARIFDGREAVARTGDKVERRPAGRGTRPRRRDRRPQPMAVRVVKRLFNRLANDGAAEQFAAERTEITAIVELGVGQP